MRHKIENVSFKDIYQMYINKVEKKNHTKQELDQIIIWLTGYNQKELENIITSKETMQTFFNKAPLINPNAKLIKGVICGHRVELIEDELMQKIRWLDKLVDELAKGKKIDKILRK
ncbi:DUF2200 domain-containing protein [Mycoplasma sp. P36-A1]|uniref:DUF2200 domain-containing protein n=1 Tax=Mycoplasma sp. P36-A1 TaxID=3252900 RepID=UPI003C2BB9E2